MGRFSPAKVIRNREKYLRSTGRRPRQRIMAASAGCEQGFKGSSRCSGRMQPGALPPHEQVCRKGTLQRPAVG